MSRILVFMLVFVIPGIAKEKPVKIVPVKRVFAFKAPSPECVRVPHHYAFGGTVPLWACPADLLPAKR